MAESAHYTFLPWYRTGLSSQIAPGAVPALARGTIDVRLKTKVDNGAEVSDAKSVHLIGPGDVIGIDRRAVIRLEPRADAGDFEPNYLAAIDFFDEDFPWRYSPRGPEGAAGARVLPWLALIVVEKAEFAWTDQGEGLPRAVAITDVSVLPPAEDLWAWAHTHLNATAANPQAPAQTAQMLRDNPALGWSRIIAARRLRPSRTYHALLVPAFEAGRRAGLLPGVERAGEMAWGRAGGVELPVYFEWTFSTGEKGSFEDLARRLVPVPPDPTVGRRPMDVSHPLPGLDLPPISDSDPAGPRAVLALEGALQIPEAKPSPWKDESRAEFQKWLSGFVNLAEVWAVDAAHQVAGGAPLPNGIKLPIVLPPSYGRWHANVTTLEPARADDRWLEQLNLDPRNRVAAAFGTLVVQKNQEDFMSRAWAQYGDLFRVNRFRYRAQLMRELLTATETKHLAPLEAHKLLAATGLAHARVAVAESLSVHGAIEVSALPVAAVQPAMRRALRPKGPISKRFGGGVGHLETVLQKVASTELRLAPAWGQPAERLTLSTPAPVDPDTTAPPDWLGSDWDVLRPLIVELIDRALRVATRVPPVGDIVPFLRELLARGDAQAVLSRASFVPAVVAEVQERPQWIPPTLQRDPRLRQEDVSPAEGNARFSAVAFNFRQAALNVSEWLTQELPPQPERPALDVPAVTSALRGRLSPYASVQDRVARVTQLPPVIKVATYDPLETIMAYPTFGDATYEQLKKISDEYVVPNLTRIANNSVTLLEVNWRFVESYLVGLNHEMARELLWRGYRTDQRGTYFAQFWDIRGVPGAIKGDIQPIHGWRRGGKLTTLGENRPANKIIKHNLVLVVRGDLLRRYPNTRVYAVRAVPNDPPRNDTFKHVSRRPGDDPARGDDVKGHVTEPVLFARFEPDVYCFGFDLEKNEARGVAPPERVNLGYYFVLAERFGEPRFGLDEPRDPVPAFPQPNVAQANDLTWAHLVTRPEDYAALSAVDLARHHPAAPPTGFAIDPDVPGVTRRAAWSSDSAEMAAILLQDPFRMYFHANDMLLP